MADFSDNAEQPVFRKEVRAMMQSQMPEILRV
jgi:hypothetical protein